MDSLWDLVLKRGIWLVIIVIGYTIPYIIEDSTSLTVVCVPFLLICFSSVFFLADGRTNYNNMSKCSG